MAEIPERLWSWVRDDTPTDEFERWAYAEVALESFLGSERWLRLVGIDFRNDDQVWRLRKDVRWWLEELAPRRCDCPTWRDDDRIPITRETMPDDFLKRFEVLRSRSPWVDLARCRVCGQAWYLALDTRDDDYWLHRLSEPDVREIIEDNRWPTTFDSIEAVWPESSVRNRAT